MNVTMKVERYLIYIAVMVTVLVGVCFLNEYRYHRAIQKAEEAIEQLGEVIETIAEDVVLPDPPQVPAANPLAGSPEGSPEGFHFD